MKHPLSFPSACLSILCAAGLSNCADTATSTGRDAESWTGRMTRQDGTYQPGVATSGTSMDVSSGTGSGTDP